MAHKRQRDNAVWCYLPLPNFVRSPEALGSQPMFPDGFKNLPELGGRSGTHSSIRVQERQPNRIFVQNGRGRGLLAGRDRCRFR